MARHRWGGPSCCPVPAYAFDARSDALPLGFRRPGGARCRRLHRGALYAAARCRARRRARTARRSACRARCARRRRSPAALYCWRAGAKERPARGRIAWRGCGTRALRGARRSARCRTIGPRLPRPCARLEHEGRASHWRYELAARTRRGTVRALDLVGLRLGHDADGPAISSGCDAPRAPRRTPSATGLRRLVDAPAAADVAPPRQRSRARRLQPRLCRRGRCDRSRPCWPTGASWARASLRKAAARWRCGARSTGDGADRRSITSSSPARAVSSSSPRRRCRPAATSSAGPATSPISRARRPSSQRHIAAHAEVLENIAVAIAIYGARHAAHLLQRRLRPAVDTRRGLARLRARPRTKCWSGCASGAACPNMPISAPSSSSSARMFTSLIEPQEELLHLPDERTLRLVVEPASLRRADLRL